MVDFNSFFLKKVCISSCRAQRADFKNLGVRPQNHAKVKKRVETFPAYRSHDST